jgi:hypothetical protein
LLTGYCSAKYAKNLYFNESAKIATPVISVEGTENTKISAIDNTGTYKFVVKNYNDEKVSDVTQNYSIEIISNTDESIEYKLYRNNENEQEEVELTDKKTGLIQIENSNKVEHEYTLQVVYDKTKSNSEQDILEDVQIKVHSEQARS